MQRDAGAGPWKNTGAGTDFDELDRDTGFQRFQPMLVLKNCEGHVFRRISTIQHGLEAHVTLRVIQQVKLENIDVQLSSAHPSFKNVVDMQVKNVKLNGKDFALPGQ